MRLLRKSVRVARTRGIRAVGALAARKLLHIMQTRRMTTAYPYHHFEPFSGIDPFRPDTIPAPRLKWQPSSTMRLRWCMPEPGQGSGGHHTLFRLIHLLGGCGHQSEVAVLHGGSTGRSRQEMRKFILEHFGVDVPVAWDTDKPSDVDVVLATSWQSAYLVAADVRCAARAYIVQDWEPDFYPRGSEQILAENSYRLGHFHVTAGPWLAERLREMGLIAEHFNLGADQATYYPSDEPRMPGHSHVVLYARPFTARRCFEIGCEALRLLDQQLGEGKLVVSMVGARMKPFPTRYRARWLGIVRPAELRRLYASADAVLVLSATNPSLVPLEAALCEAPVVDLDVPSARGTFIHGVTGQLSPPSPASLARTLADILADPDAARALGRRARAHALGFTWQAAAHTVERLLLQALQQRSHPRVGASASRQTGGAA